MKPNPLRDQRGAVIIHVAIALLALLAFTAFVVDYGVMWVSRRQAQTAADAGALSGALSLMTAPSDQALAVASAQTVAGQNVIWGEAPAPAHVQVSTPLPFPCPPSAGGGNGCIRVDVIRGTQDRSGTVHTNYLPTYFAQVVGQTTQGIRATATAQVTRGDAVRCIKPWIVADKWQDFDGTTHPPGGWTQDDTFNPSVDRYTRPGFRDPADFGLEIILKDGQIGQWSAGWTQQIDFGQTGSAAYRDEIVGCPDWVPTVGTYDGSVPCSVKTDENPEKGCVSVKTGMAQGPTAKQGVDVLVSRDPSAYWNPATSSVSGGCMAAGACSLSPRVVPIASFDTTAYVAQSASCSGTTCVARVAQLLGFFVEGMCDDVYPVAASRPAYCGTPAEAHKVVVGRLTHYPGQIMGSTGGPTGSSFVTVVRLVR